LRGCFVTGTDTGVGKTVLAAAIIAALRARGVVVKPLKPVITGLDEPSDPDWPHDHELLARAAGCAPEDVAPVRYGPPVSPHLAAQLAGVTLALARIREAVRGPGVLVVEGVGGLLVPLADGYGVRELAQDVGLPLVIAARPGLGTINHTLLTLAAARSAGLQVAGVVLTPWPDRPGEIERSNRDTIARLGAVAVAALPRIARGEEALLAAAGMSLPIDEWLG
jgi:dethiobiotin synthetase